MNPNNRCIFSSQAGCLLTSNKSSVIFCDGLKDKQRCPFWAIAAALSRIETSIQMLEGRE